MIYILVVVALWCGFWKRRRERRSPSEFILLHRVARRQHDLPDNSVASRHDASPLARVRRCWSLSTVSAITLTWDLLSIQGGASRASHVPWSTVTRLRCVPSFPLPHDSWDSRSQSMAGTTTDELRAHPDHHSGLFVVRRRHYSSKHGPFSPIFFHFINNTRDQHITKMWQQIRDLFRSCFGERDSIEQPVKPRNPTRPALHRSSFS